ncbi:MAG: DUF6273 domain-containing protein [Lachnospiraceae bacterium]|nr:DUF6273 domain-containing protein [Lachnospiraceae bacterium]
MAYRDDAGKIKRMIHKKRKSLKNILCAGAAVVLLLLLTGGAEPETVLAESYNMNLGTDMLVSQTPWNAGDGQILYYGHWLDTPTAYRVLPDSAETQTAEQDSILLDADRVLWQQPFQNSLIANGEQESGNPNEWSGCDLEQYLEEKYNALFSALEAETVVQTELLAREAYNPGYATVFDYASSNRLFLLSAQEISTLYTNETEAKKEGENSYYWLRSASLDQDNFVGMVFSNGRIFMANVNGAYIGVSPAFRLNKDAVLLVSKTTGWSGKSAAVSEGAVGSSSGREWKVTLKDEAKSVSIPVGRYMTEDENGVITVPFTCSDDNDQNPINQISVMITDRDCNDADAQILYYGALQDIRNEAGEPTSVQQNMSGTGTFPMPDGIPSDVQIYILAEHISSDYSTDYASMPADTRHVHCVCGAGTDIGDHVTHTDVEWQALPYGYTGGSLSAGNYCLDEDLSLQEPMVLHGEVSVCLNGHKVSYDGADAMVQVTEGSTLHVGDCLGTGSFISSETTMHLVSGEVYQYGGEIYGTVWIEQGSYYFNGGKVEGNPGFVVSGGSLYLSGEPQIPASSDKNTGIQLGEFGFIYAQGAGGVPYTGETIRIQTDRMVGEVAVYGVVEQNKAKFVKDTEKELYAKDGVLVVHDYHIGGRASYFRKAVCDICGEEYGELVTDTMPPTGTIRIGAHTWDTLFAKLTFDLYFNQKQDVTISASDDSYEQEGFTEDKEASIYYYVDESGGNLQKEELQNKTFLPYSSAFAIEPDKQCVVYARLTDHAGNSTYLSSQGIILDATAPVIHGVTEGGSYSDYLHFTVTDDHLDTVMVDGNILKAENGVYTLQGKETQQTITVTDFAGNKSTKKVTVKVVTHEQKVHAPDTEDRTGKAAPYLMLMLLAALATWGCLSVLNDSR